MLFEQLSDFDKDLIEEYIRHYAIDVNPAQAPADLSYILRIWDSENENLYHLLGDNLIIHKSITYEKDRDELENELCQELFNQFSSGAKFSSAFYKLSHRGGALAGNYEVEHLTNLQYLVTNKYTGSTFTIPLPNGKTYKVQTGAKTMRVLGKIAKEFNLPGFDEFCLAHSQVLNQKKISGELHLSIHPMDYMTMSDNNSDWISCMNWIEWGEYRMGTVEMMNSPVVVVAYITNNRDKFYPLGRSSDTWNNKKWRELFIVNKGIITGIKGYPYENKDIERIVSEWIKELAQKNLNWNYKDEYITYIQNNPIKEIECKDCKREHPAVSFYTYTMYNDFFERERYGYFNSEHINKECTKWYKDLDTTPEYQVVYSGATECMWCGNTSDKARFDNSDCLVCDSCATYDYCTCCGSRITDTDDAILVDGEWYCMPCYEENFSSCDLCGDMFTNDSLYQVQIIDSETGHMMKPHSSIYLCEDCYHDFVKNEKVVECCTKEKNHSYIYHYTALLWDKMTDREKRKFGFNPGQSFEDNLANNFCWWGNEPRYDEAFDLKLVTLDS